MQERKLIFSIILTLCLLLSIQIIGVLLIGMWHGINFRLWDWYMPIAIILHGIIAILLCLLTKEFHTIPQGKKLTRVNFINKISLFRISSTPTLVLFITNSYADRLNTIIVVWAAGIFLSDFLDGKLARRFGQMTKIGQYIDSWSDYIILLVIGVLLYNHSFVPRWFFISAVMRILLPILGMVALYTINCDTHYHTSWFGRASIFAIMTVFAFSLTRALFRDVQLHRQIATVLGMTAVIGFIIPALIVWSTSFVKHLQDTKHVAD